MSHKINIKKGSVEVSLDLDMHLTQEDILDLCLELSNKLKVTPNFYYLTVCKPDPSNRAKCIKAVRVVTGLGLKESKDLVYDAADKVMHLPARLREDEVASAEAELTPYFSKVEVHQY
jgi:ribosomal protein L7/L12